ncbi:penicillin-binding protein [Deinococcus cellulosilyticus NBRC 106333 = KACC 11606]|uniref:peptidoglycan glycosyltransferase n=1 Tax=Deinococcus cellulosilyticus (strain DSM 18568 / NBRC 106333 / KACC 11606 / 5516J-15) TaxID=1223518 RepID=A0A511MWW3_DEIC1|nr:penicillin-binding protein [Deinococcus cellulosilyticus NBRC 106333 = KACC 11606]
MLLLGAIALGILLYRWQPDLSKVPSLRNLQYGGRAILLDQEGRLLRVVSVSPEGHVQPARKFLSAGQISPWLQRAVVASEDERFHQHSGVDFRGLSRALWKTVSGDLEGGSTITQQVVKNTLLADFRGARTPERKVKEAMLALEVEKQFSKEEILNLYLNLIYWGVGRTDLIGAQDAARAYFNKNAKDLNLAESVYLAVLLPTPARYNDYKGYRPLMKNLLDRMVKNGTITPSEADQAWKFPLKPAGWTVKYDKNGNLLSARLTDAEARKKNFPQPEYQYADAFLDQVERELLKHVKKEAFFTSDIKVYTTLNRKAQLAAEQASIKANVPKGATLGIALIDPHSGDVQALVGQKLNDGIAEQWNHAVRSRRQVGSSIKPLLYTLALSKGWNQTDMVMDQPLKGKYQPQNYSGSYTGKPIMLRAALDHSLNLPTVRLLQKVGVTPFKQKLSLMGLHPDPQAGLSIGIGALEATPLEMAAAYAPFASGGMYRTPRFIQKITANGEVLTVVKQSTPVRVWSEPVAYMGLDMIRGVVNDLTPAQGGLGWNARIPGWPVGGKTGTTNDVKDLWFVGVTPKLAGAVWVGRSNNTAMPRNAYSGTVAAPIWQKALALALKGERGVAFNKPSSIRTREVAGVYMAFLKPQQVQPDATLLAAAKTSPVRPVQKAVQKTTQKIRASSTTIRTVQNKTVSQSTLAARRLAEARRQATVVRQQQLLRQAQARRQAALNTQRLEQRRRALRAQQIRKQSAFIERQQQKARIARLLNAKTRKHFEKQYRKYVKQNHR